MEMDQQVWRTVQQRQKERVWTFSALGEAYKERQHHLQRLKAMLENNEKRWLEALHLDLGKPAVEGYASEIAVLLNEIDYTMKQLKEWMAPETAKRTLLGSVEHADIQRLPHGSVLIVSPWNYPLQLALMPLIGALAAGNSCFLKPSEYAPATSRLLAHLIGRYFPREVVTVVEGGADTAEQLLGLDWDFIFFTGSKRVGKIVHQKAAEQTIPVVLELGGKNPCIVDETGVTRERVQQIVWGKFLNAGQSCIAPDTVYVQETVLPQFLESARESIRAFYGDASEKRADFGQIVSHDHFDRLVGYLHEGRVYSGGRHKREERFLEPTLLTEVDPKSRVLQDEIFGPVLPVVPYTNLNDLLKELNAKPSPLVTYFFSREEAAAQKAAQRVRSGAFSFNQVIRHAAASHLPFGGVGASGFGRYHGKAGFDTFTYQKVQYTQKPFIGSTVQYPPYKASQLGWLKKLRKYLF